MTGMLLMNDDRLGIIFILIGMSLFSVQDILVRSMSDVGSLIQIMTVRGIFGGLILIGFLKYTGWGDNIDIINFFIIIFKILDFN